MSALLAAIVLVAYASLAFELTVLHVPSVASSLNIWSRPPTVEAAYSPAYRGVFGLSRPTKLLMLALPLIVTYGVYLYPLMAVFGSRDPLGDHMFVPLGITDALSALMVVTGRVIALGSVISVRSANGRATEPVGLCTSGPFRYSRNPGLIGMYVFVVGLWLAAPSLTMLGGMLAYVLYMDFKVRMEEDYLQNRFGESYHTYRQRTSRYWP